MGCSTSSVFNQTSRSLTDSMEAYQKLSNLYMGFSLIITNFFPLKGRTIRMLHRFQLPVDFHSDRVQACFCLSPLAIIDWFPSIIYNSGVFFYAYFSCLNISRNSCVTCQTSRKGMKEVISFSFEVTL